MRRPERFSVLIPTWNSLDHLRLCVRSLREHSAREHEIVVHVNDGSDGTAAWVEEEGLAWTRTAANAGVCVGVNRAFARSTREIVVYLNDDMVVLPGWDTAIADAVAAAPTPLFSYSATAIERRRRGDGCCVVGDYGASPADFREAELLRDLPGLVRDDWSGASWPPNVVPRALWERVGGLSESYSPGLYSDPDLSMKLWQAGCRDFRGLGRSLVYHFGGRSTARVRHNRGRRLFVRTWKLHPSTFYRHYLRMGEPYRGSLAEPAPSLALAWHRWRGRLGRWLP